MSSPIPVPKLEYERYCADRAWSFIILWFIGSGAAAITWASIERGSIAGAVFCGLIALGCFGGVILDYLAGPKYTHSLTDSVMKDE